MQKISMLLFLALFLMSCQPEEVEFIDLNLTVRTEIQNSKEKNDANRIRVRNIEALRKLPFSNTKTRKEVLVLGYYEPGDEGGGVFYWDPISKEEDNGGTIISIENNNEMGRWKREYKDTINVKWFGAKGDGIFSDVNLIQKVLIYADIIKRDILIPQGNYLINKQLVLTNASITGEAGKSKIIIPSDFSFTETNSGKSSSCIFNSSYGAISNQSGNTIYIKGLDIECSVKSDRSIVVLGLSNIKKGKIEDLKLTINNVSKKAITGIDLRASCKNIDFENVDINNYNEASSGSGIWVRNITAAGDSQENNTENINFLNCDIKHAGGDEAFAVYGVQGRTENIKVIKCTFESLPSSERHSVLVSAFALNNGRPEGRFASVKNILFDHCRFIDFNFSHHVFRAGQTGLDSLNLTEGIIIQNSEFIVSKDRAEISYVARNIGSIGYKNHFIGNKIIENSSGEFVTYGVYGFDLVKGNYIKGKFSYCVAGSSTVTNNNLDGISGVGIYNSKEINKNKVWSYSHCVLIDSNSFVAKIEDNILENLNSNGKHFTGIFIKSFNSKNPNALIRENRIKMNSADNYAIRRDGIGDVRVLENVITGAGKPLLSSHFLNEINGNSWYGIQDDIRENPYFDYDYNKAIPLGQKVKNIHNDSLVEGWIKIYNYGNPRDWEAVEVLPDF